MPIRTNIPPSDTSSSPRLATERLGAARVKFDGDDLRPGSDQRSGERPLAPADIQHEPARPYAGRRDDPLGPAVSEPVPSPRRPGPARVPGGGHGTSPCNSPWP